MKLDGWADGAVRRLSTETREHFALDPLASLREDLGLTVTEAPHLQSGRFDGGACDGVSYLDDGVVFYAPSQWSKRQNFTLAHELGHWLVERDDALMDWLGNQDRAEIVLESICDAIAQRLLLPPDLVNSVVGRPVRAQDILDLSEGSAASVPASAIAVTARLPHMGATIIIDTATREVTAATVHPDPDLRWPVVHPWRGDVVPAGHSLLNVRPGDTFTRKSFWRSQWGRREDFYIDAVATAGRVVALMSAVDIWGIDSLYTPDDRAWDRRPVAEIFCCGQLRTIRGFPCPTCGRQFCPVCGGCGCTGLPGTERECSQCHTLVGAHLLQNGLCEWCA
ncbi:ImmA/IrrE family metallo-endopeptidase [Frigoribacterium sp. CFBP 8759]|uniref:ImmA/IrrE family metallo-endopeptidase n=1 Tax=Frigoribacterium sp. CFBP 8759 TaxID=2775283 RepID=UPI00177B337D|nr:ImmA/IrrE family metallo-endopeptidase [Frigoribacterium sp. CFBP 8759]MBD8485864.1 ImmA/IrrE family metallo-endopeptidase [Frigoribacterium sp. CFBP 8759]